ncbi:hypothetical protein [Actinomyces qiguomingii]|uniref:hypothetical protein n=1 Tax=Actinomyces qiguomingii TaxID=2057800 RepID=UPI000CA00A7E|nr:hypothetical protein [Actinomyces qiguomingii]
MKNSRFTIEEMRETASEVLARFDRDREIQRLLRQGLTPQQVIERTGSEPRFVAHVGQQMERGEPVRPETPEELIFRRFLGQISSQEMMDRLRTWPYTFGRIRDYDDYERGSWDDVDGLSSFGYLSDQEYHELRAITDPMPKPPDDPMPWDEDWRPQ